MGDIDAPDDERYAAFMYRPIIAPSTAIILAACGARTNLDQASQGGVASVGGASSDGGGGAMVEEGGGGGSGGSAPLVCQQLAWAGDPVFVDLPFGNTVTTPRLVATGDGDYGLTFDAITDAVGHTVGSFPIHQPFQSWPPILGAADLNLPTPHRFAVSTGSSAMFAFAAADGAGNIVLGEALPGQNGSTLVAFPTGAQGVHFLSRNGDAYLTAQGADDYLSVLGFTSFSPDALPIQLGTLGCAAPVFASAIPAGSGFLVVSAVDNPFDDCADPDLPGPPLYVQTHRVELGSGALPGSFIAVDGPVDELLLAPRPGGAWLAVHITNQTGYFIRTVDEATLTISEPIANFASIRRFTRHALTAAGDSYALAALLPNELFPGGDLIIGVNQGGRFFDISAGVLGVVPTGDPTMVASDDGRSFLVAFRDDSFGPGSVALIRADCVDVGGD